MIFRNNEFFEDLKSLVRKFNPGFVAYLFEAVELISVHVIVQLSLSLCVLYNSR